MKPGMILKDSALYDGFSLTPKLVEQASEYVLELLQESLSPDFVFHNQRYTVQTVHAVSLISKAEEISLQDQLMLKIAAWFHHTGLTRTAEQHRIASAELATRFLKRYAVEQKIITRIVNVILNSGTAWDVTSLFDMVLHDADWYFLAASNYQEMLDRRKEEMLRINGQLTRLQWFDFIDECFVQHQYLTNYGQEFLHNLRRVNYLNYKNSGQQLITRELLEPKSNF